MCDVNGPFKLCTCDTSVDRTKPHWILHRYIQSKEEYQVMGEFRTPNPYQQISTRSLKRRLNSINVFDFEYKPIEGDYLELFLSPEIECYDGNEDEEDDVEFDPDYILEFKNGKWVLLEPWVSNLYQHSLTHSGEILAPKTELTIAYEDFKEKASSNQLSDFEYENIYPLTHQSMRTKKGLIDFFKKSISE
jgi:hypothetical protein